MFRSCVYGLQLQLLKHPECLLSGDLLGRNPAANARCLQVSKGTISNLSEDDICAAETNCNLDGALAVQPFILHKFANPIIRVSDHDPFGFAKMRRHLLISAIR
jgi:hypothetical protein